MSAAEGSQTGLIAWWVRNPVAANLLMVCLIAGGLFSIFTIKKEIFPAIETNFITVTVPYLGAAPAEVEEGVLVKVEEAIEDIIGIREITATAREGSGQIAIEVDPAYDPDLVMNDVKNRVDGISTFPALTEAPVISRSQFEQQVMWVSVFGQVDERTLKEYTQRLRDEIVQLENVTRASIAGGRDYEITIELDEATLQKYALTFDEVASAIRASSLDLPGGSIKTDSGDILLRTKGQAYVGRDFQSIVLRTHQDGTRLTVGDVARVVDGFEDRDRYARHNGQPAIAMSVVATADQSELKIAASVRDFVDARQQTLPEGIGIEIWGDTSYYLKGRLELMSKNLLFGALLVFGILALFLRLKLAFWVMVGLLVAFLGTFFTMPLLGVSVNMLSLFGLILVLGIVVDDAIVIGESIDATTRERGHTVDNAIIGARRVAMPATFGVLTTIAAFLPTVMISGINGAFFSAIGWVVMLCMAFSLVESKWILPAHLAHMRPPVARRRESGSLFGRLGSGFARLQDRVADALAAFVSGPYDRWLTAALKHRYVTGALFIAGMFMTFGLIASGLVKVIVFPDFAADFIQSDLEMSAGTSTDHTAEMMDRIRHELTLIDRQISADNGLEAGGVVETTFAFVRSGGLSGQIVVELVKEENALISTTDLMRLWRERVGDIPGARAFSIRGAGGPPQGPPISYQLVGNDYQSLLQAGQALEQKIRSYAGVYDIRNSFEGGNRELQLSIRPSAEALGLSQNDLARQVRQAFYGEEVQRIQRGNDEVKVMVRYPREQRESLGYLEQMRIRTPAGDAVPFQSVARATFDTAPSTISRIDRQRAISLSAEVDKAAGIEPGEINTQIDAWLQSELAARFPGVRYNLSGGAREQVELIAELIAGLLFAFFLIYALMAIPLKSYAQPFIIMSVIPFGIIGAIVGHWIAGFPISMLSMFGIIALSGVVVNDSLILVDFINRRLREGHPILQAAREAARQRFRAILLTSATTFLGLAPIIFFEKSFQAMIVIPMAISLAFGILFATVITLFLIPCLYFILEDFKAGFRRVFGTGQDRVLDDSPIAKP